MASVAVTQLGSISLDLPELARLRALAARPGVPEWARVRTGVPASARDDDLRSSWSCAPQGDEPCAWLASFDEPVELAVIRVVAGDFAHASAKIRKLRLHTDVGLFELEGVKLLKPRFYAFTTPIRTQSLAIEVVGAKASKARPLRLAEIELYGVSGPSREPLTLDPEAAWVSWAATPGAHALTDKNKGWARLHANVCMHVPTGAAAPCFTRATAAYGVRGDRLALFEAIHRSNCERHGGVWVLLDQHTRRLVKLDGIPGPPAAVYRHRNGLGFAFNNGKSRAFVAITLDPVSGELERVELAHPHALEAAGFELRYTPRGGGGNLRHLGRDCEYPSMDWLEAHTPERESAKTRALEHEVLEVLEALALDLGDEAPYMPSELGWRICEESSTHDILLGPEAIYRMRGASVVDGAAIVSAGLHLARGPTGEFVLSQLIIDDRKVSTFELDGTRLVSLREASAPVVDIDSECDRLSIDGLGGPEFEIIGPVEGIAGTNEDEDEDDGQWDEEGWALDPDDAPKHPTGVKAVDQRIHDILFEMFCLFDTESGDLDGVGPDDWLATFGYCETGEVAGTEVFLVGSGGKVRSPSMPGIEGPGSIASFEQLESGERVLVLSTSCCMPEIRAIIHLRGDRLEIGQRASGDDVDVIRDRKGRLVRLEVVVEDF